MLTAKCSSTASMKSMECVVGVVSYPCQLKFKLGTSSFLSERDPYPYQWTNNAHYKIWRDHNFYSRGADTGVKKGHMSQQWCAASMKGTPVTKWHISTTISTIICLFSSHLDMANKSLLKTPLQPWCSLYGSILGHPLPPPLLLTQCDNQTVYYYYIVL